MKSNPNKPANLARFHRELPDIQASPVIRRLLTDRETVRVAREMGRQAASNVVLVPARRRAR